MVWNPGQELFGDRYIIKRKLGEGGIGITYLAKNQRGELRVIKTLREQILNHPAWISKINYAKTFKMKLYDWLCVAILILSNAKLSIWLNHYI